MSRLPDFENAIIPPEKLLYSLGPTHGTGAHKARVFKSALGLGPGDEDLLRRMLVDGIAAHEAVLRAVNPDGTQRWMVEWTVAARLGPLKLITGWRCSANGTQPRLVSSYLKKVKSP
jgi:hypothetical protein